MARIQWEHGALDVQRIVLDELTPHWMRSTLQGLAMTLGLGFAGRNVTPKAGDLWIGRVPEKGWGGTPSQIGWVRGDGVYRVITQLRQADPIYAIEAQFDAPARV